MKKIMKQLIVPATLVLLFSACNSNYRAMMKAGTQKTITAAIDSTKWIFTPITMIPQFDNSRPVFGGYTVTCKRDTLSVYLPYYGRAYAGADLLSTTNPLDFISTNFAIDRTLVKEGQWKITLKPKERSEVQLMSFTFFSNGSADLTVIMTNRSSVNFTGNIDPIKE